MHIEADQFNALTAGDNGPCDSRYSDHCFIFMTYY